MKKIILSILVLTMLGAGIIQGDKTFYAVAPAYAGFTNPSFTYTPTPTPTPSVTTTTQQQVGTRPCTCKKGTTIYVIPSVPTTVSCNTACARSGGVVATGTF